VDFTVPSDAALRWLGDFVHLGACAVVAVHVCSPARERERLGVSDTTEKNATEMRAILERDVRDRVSQTAGLEDYHVRIDLSRAKNDARLIEIAAEEQADLIVVGTHQRHGFDLVWPGSVSRAVLQNAPVSVVCVPVMADTPGSLTCVPPVNCVLAATDLSPLGNLALPHACSLLGAGGVVRFLHVVHPQALPGGEFHQGPGTSPRHARLVRDAHRRLLALVPPDAAAHGLQVDVEIVEERLTARAICQAARRCGADVICLGTQGHTDLSNVLLGSVALAVLKATRRPVLLVRPPKA
jgi:nucleotide-binding universal stress UspA family protein